MIKYFTHIILFFGLIIFNSFCFSQNLDSLKLAFKNAKHDTTRCNILNAMIEEESDDNVWSKYNEQLKSIAEKNLATGGVLKKNYKKHLAASLNNIGYLANNQGEITKSLDYFHRSLKIQEEIGEKRGMAESYNNIGAIYKKQEDLNMALDYYNKGLKLYNEIKNVEGMGTAYNNIAGIYDNLNDLENALEYYLKSLKIQEETGEYNGIGLAFNNIGYIYYRQTDHAKALESFQNSLKIYQQIGDKSGIVNSLCNIAFLLAENGKANQAFDYANQAMEKSKELGFPESIKNSAQALKKVFEKQNKYKDAFEMYELEIKMRDSINNKATQQAAIKKQMQYIYEKKDIAVKAEQVKKDAIAKAELKQKEKERNYFVVGFGLVLVLALFILRGYKQKQKANEIITQQKILVDEKQKEILDSIHYAKRIQAALLPSENYIDKRLSQLNKN